MVEKLQALIDELRKSEEIKNSREKSLDVYKRQVIQQLSRVEKLSIILLKFKG